MKKIYMFLLMAMMTSVIASAQIRYIDSDMLHNEIMPNYDRPIVLDFCASWCGPCQKYAPVMDKAKAIAAIGSVSGYTAYTAQACGKCDVRDDVRKCGKCSGFLTAKCLEMKGRYAKYEYKCKDCNHVYKCWVRLY